MPFSFFAAPAFDQVTVPTADPPSMAACPPPARIPVWGRGSRLHEELSYLRQLRKSVIKGRADADSVQWFRSGGLDQRLQELTVQHGAGRYWDAAGKQIDLRPTAFENYLDHSRPP